MNGLEFQAQLTEMGVRLPVVMMTGYGDISMSVRAMKHGAVDFLLKPFRDQDMLDAVSVAISSRSCAPRRLCRKDLAEREVCFAFTAGASGDEAHNAGKIISKLPAISASAWSRSKSIAARRCAKWEPERSPISYGWLRRLSFHDEVDGWLACPYP